MKVIQGHRRIDLRDLSTSIVVRVLVDKENIDTNVR